MGDRKKLHGKFHNFTKYHYDKQIKEKWNGWSIQHLCEARNRYKIFVGKPEGKR
jgi:hypothetical protein